MCIDTNNKSNIQMTLSGTGAVVAGELVVGNYLPRDQLTVSINLLLSPDVFP